MSLRVGKSGPVTIGSGKKRTMRQFLKDTGYRFSQYDGWAKCPITSFKGVLEYDDLDFDKSKVYTLFWGFDKLEEVPSLNTTGAPFFGHTFDGCKSLKEVPYFDTSSVERWEYCFKECESLEYIHPLDTSKGDRFECMFYNCKKLRDASWLNTSSNAYNVMNELFFNCNSLTSVPEVIDTSNVKSMRSTFCGCYELEALPEFTDTSKVTYWFAAFENCRKITALPSSLNTSSATNLTYLCRYCYALKEIPALDTSKVTTFDSTFSRCTSLTTVPALDFSAAINTRLMFYFDSGLKTVPALNTSKVTDMADMFCGCTSLTTVEEIDMTSVTRMEGVFNNCGSLTQLSVKGQPKPTAVNSSFSGCSKLPDSMFPSIDTTNITKMWYTYYGCSLLEDPKWTGTPPKLVGSANAIFYNCPKLKEVPEMDWSQVTGYDNYCFIGCTSLTAIHVKNIPLSLNICTLTNLGHDALVEIIGNLMDKTGGTTQTLWLSSAHKASLSDAELKVATDKNWTVTVY